MDEFEFTNCLVCGSNKFSKRYLLHYSSEKVLEKLYIHNLPEAVYLYKCLNCGHNYANPLLKDEYLDKYYAILDSEYFNNDNYFLDKEHTRLVKIIEKIKVKGNVLEIGCGKGHLLDKLKKYGLECYGVEPSPSASNYAKEKFGLNIVNGFLAENTFPKLKFDLIILLDVLEHIKNPNELIRLVKYYLKPNGVLIIGTGNIDSFNARLSGKYWGYFGSWEHISFFTFSSIKYLLKMNEFNCYIKKTSYKIGFWLNFLNLIKNILILSKISIKKIILILNIKHIALNNTLLVHDHFLVFAKHK